jgi:hypothetical protein
MKEMIKTENSSNIMIGVGVLGLLAYGYLLLFSNISIEYLKYSVLACAFAALLPFALTIRKMTEEFSTGAFWGIVIGVAALVFLVAYSMMKPTDEGIVFDLFAVVSSDSFRWLYLVIIIIATICPFVWGKGAPWITAVAVGVLVPVILSTILVLLAIVIGCYILSLFGKSKGSSSSGLSSWLGESTSTKAQENTKPIQTNVVDNRRYARIKIKYGRSVDECKTDYALYRKTEALPVDFSYDQISRYLKRKYSLGYDPVVVDTEIEIYTTKDSVHPIAFKV